MRKLMKYIKVLAFIHISVIFCYIISKAFGINKLEALKLTMNFVSNNAILVTSLIFTFHYILKYKKYFKFAKKIGFGA